MASYASSSGLAGAIEDAQSPSWSLRASAGGRLAPYAGVPSAADALERLLLDPEDTAVTRETAHALLMQRSFSAVRLVALAVARADDNQADWLHTAAQDLVWQQGEVGRDISALCAFLADDPHSDVQRGAAEILRWTAA